jgi:hypothetical protein
MDGRAPLLDGQSRRNPIAFLTCNFPPPGTDGKPSLLTHNDVLTLFHEFGHGLHHLLTEVSWPSVGGISGVEWDAVELPSQFMENLPGNEALVISPPDRRPLAGSLFRKCWRRRFCRTVLSANWVALSISPPGIRSGPRRQDAELLDEGARKSRWSSHRPGIARRTRSRTSSVAAMPLVTTVTSGRKC